MAISNDSFDMESCREFLMKGPLGFAICDRATGRYLAVNEAFAKILGRTVADTLARDYWEITPKKYKQQENEQLQALENTGRYGPYEKKFIHKNHTIDRPKLVPVRLSGQLIKAPDGTKYIWSFVEDRSADELPLEHYRELVMKGPYGFAVCEKETGKYLLVNEAFARILGRDVWETLACDYWEITPKKYEKLERKQLDELDVTERYGPYEKQYIHKKHTEKDPKLIPVRLSGRVLKSLDGTECIWSLVEDLSKDKYRVLFDKAQMGLALCTMDGNGTLLDVNQAFADYLGMSVRELEWRTYWEITPECYHDRELEVLETLKNDRIFGPYNKELIHKDHTPERPKLVPVVLWGLIVQLNGIDYIWSIVQKGQWGGDVGPPPPQPGSSVKPIRAPTRSTEEQRRLLDPIPSPAGSTNEPTEELAHPAEERKKLLEPISSPAKASLDNAQGRSDPGGPGDTSRPPVSGPFEGSEDRLGGGETNPTEGSGG